MSTEHHKHDDQRLKPNAPGEQVGDPGIQVVPADEMEPASVIAEIPGDDSGASTASSAHDQRWHDVLANFIYDPRGSVLAATELVVDDVSAFVAVLDQRKKSMLNASTEDDAASTEDLRQTAAAYRDISKQLTASIQALNVATRAKPARRDLEAERRDREAERPDREPERRDREPERREVIGGRFDTAGGRHVIPRRDAPPGQPPPGKPSSQDQRRRQP